MSERIADRSEGIADRRQGGPTVNVHLLTPLDSALSARTTIRPHGRVARITRWLVLIAVLVPAGLLGVRRLESWRTPTVVVGVHRVTSGRVEETLTNSRAGTVRAVQRAALSPELAGRVVAIPVVEGQRVRRGQVLLRLADDEALANAALQRRLRDAMEADARQVCTTAERAAREFARVRALGADQLVSAAAIDQAATESGAAAAACDAARAHVASAGAAIAAADVVVRRTVLRAPFDAVVADVHTEVGEWITPAPPGIPVPPVIEIIAPGGLSVRAPLDEVDLSRVRVGLAARVTFDAVPGATLAGKVTRVAPYVFDRQEEGRTVDVDVALDQPADAPGVLAGTSADIEIIVRARDHVLRVPTNAIIDDRGVLVVDDNRLVERRVRFGLRNWAFAEVTDGLTPGDAIVVTLDRAGVHPGARVRVEAGRTP
jgi:HlyD family secretion protein